MKFSGPPPEPIEHSDRITHDTTPRRMSTRSEIESFMARLRR